MSDYVSKPVQFARIEEVLTRWCAARSSVVDPTEVPEGLPSVDARTVEPTALPIEIEKTIEALGGDLELMREVVRTFLQSLPEMLADVQAASAADDRANLMAAAHTLKGAASNIGAEQTRSAAERLETWARSEGAGHQRPALNELEQHLAAVAAFATVWLDRGDST